MLDSPLGFSLATPYAFANVSYLKRRRRALQRREAQIVRQKHRIVSAAARYTVDARWGSLAFLRPTGRPARVGISVQAPFGLDGAHPGAAALRELDSSRALFNRDERHTRAIATTLMHLDADLAQIRAELAGLETQIAGGAR